MFTKTKISAVISLFLFLSLTAASFPKAPNPEPQQNCYVLLEPLQIGKESPKAPNIVCGNSTTLAATTIVGIDYSGSLYSGTTLNWTTTNSQGCTGGSSFVSPSMPSGWNDVVSSAKGYQGCNNNPHWESTYYGGASITCMPNCSTMGAIDNKTSSVKWKP